MSSGTRQPLVSVIVPTRNRARLVVRAVESVLGQTYGNLECIVVDDASEDETPGAVATFEDPRLVYVGREERGGASAARNIGLRRARGEYIAFLDDDDEWLPEKLELQVPLLRDSPHTTGLVYCWMDYFDADGRCVREHHPTLRGYVFGSVLDRQRIGGCPTLLVRREVIEEVGGFDEELPRGNDGDFIRRICLAYGVDLIPRVLVRVHVGHGSDRITTRDPIGIRNAIQGQQAKLEKFADVLDRYPRQTAHVLAQIGFHEGELGAWKAAARRYGQALERAPFHPRIYRLMLRTLSGLLLRKRHG